MRKTLAHGDLPYDHLPVTPEVGTELVDPLAGEQHDLGAGDVLQVPAGAPHQMCATWRRSSCGERRRRCARTRSFGDL
ncbi:MAG: hypothetical protein ABR614_06975 [Mycobacteriales bacterium]